MFPIMSLLVLVGGALGLSFLIRFLIQKGVSGIAAVAIVAGIVGIAVPLVILMGDSSRETQRAILVAGSIIFGCGTIAASFGSKKE